MFQVIDRVEIVYKTCTFKYKSKKYIDITEQLKKP